MDYLTFHLIFTVPLLIALAAICLRKRQQDNGSVLWGTGVVALIAFIYTTPWDSYMIRQGAWRYGDGRVLMRFWEIPVGEYLFL